MAAWERQAEALQYEDSALDLEDLAYSSGDSAVILNMPMRNTVGSAMTEERARHMQFLWIFLPLVLILIALV